MLSSFCLLQNGLQCDLARDITRCHLDGGISHGREGGWGSRERVVELGGGGWGEAWMGQLRGAQRGPSVLVVPVMSRAAICNDRHVGFVIYLQHRFRVYTPERLSHVPQRFQTDQSRGLRGSRTVFSCSLRAVGPSPLGRRARTPYCEFADRVQIGDYALFPLLGGFFGRAGKGCARCSRAEVVRES